jgi:hypothetical protein
VFWYAGARGIMGVYGMHALLNRNMDGTVSQEEGMKVMYEQYPLLFKGMDQHGEGAVYR